MSKEKLTCHVCGKIFTSKLSNLNKHLLDFHNEVVITPKRYIKCLELNCGFSASQLKYLRSHLEDSHQIKQLSETLYFKTVADFELWKAEEEQKSNCRWSKICGSMTYGKKNMTVYYCNRSGKKRLVDSTIRKRRSRAQGSCKLNSFCTSSIVMQKQSNQVMVAFHKSHYGHSVVQEEETTADYVLNLSSATVDETSGPNIDIENIKDSIAGKLVQISSKVSIVMDCDLLKTVNSQLDNILQLQVSQFPSNVKSPV